METTIILTMILLTLIRLVLPFVLLVVVGKLLAHLNQQA